MENAELPEEDSVDMNAILDTIDFQTASDVGSLQTWQAPFTYICLTPHAHGMAAAMRRWT